MSLYKPEETSQLSTQVIRRPGGGWAMITEWDGAYAPNAIFFSSAGEMTVLTPEEAEARDTMVAALADRERLIETGRELAMAEANARISAERRALWTFVISGWVFLGLLYAFTPFG